MDIGQWIVIGLSALFLIWFLAGAATSRKLGDQVLHWVQGGTRQLGRLSEARRVRGSAVQLTIKDVAAPFRQLDLIVALEPRENPPLWLYQHMNGKRDELSLQGILRSAPKQEWEVKRMKPQPGTDGHPADISLSKSSGKFTLTPAQEIDPAILELLDEFLMKYDLAVREIRLKRSAPHLQAWLMIGPLLQTDSQEFFKDLQGLLS